jgi:hypothetical protein
MWHSLLFGSFVVHPTHLLVDAAAAWEAALASVVNAAAERAAGVSYQLLGRVSLRAATGARAEKLVAASGLHRDSA